jgi:hypothetical protein
VRINLHSRSDLAAKVQYNLVTFLEARFNLYDIPIAYPDFDVAKPYHVFVRIAAWGFGRNKKAATGPHFPTLTSFQACIDDRVRGRRKPRP